MSELVDVPITIEEMRCANGHSFDAHGDAISDRQLIVWNGEAGSERLVDPSNSHFLSAAGSILKASVPGVMRLAIISRLKGSVYDRPKESGPAMRALDDDETNPRCQDHPDAQTVRTGIYKGRTTIHIPLATASRWEAMSEDEQREYLLADLDNQLAIVDQIRERSRAKWAEVFH